MDLQIISEKLQSGRHKEMAALVQQALDEGASAQQILDDGLMAGMAVISEKFKNEEIYVPEVLLAARAMNKGMQVLKPYLAGDSKATGKACIGTVAGDSHDVGKNLVKMLLEGKGIEVIDLGTNVSPQAYVDCVKENGCQLVCLSALLTTTMGVMADVVKAFEDAGLRDKVKIMVGGAPITTEYCEKIGADVYTPNAAACADAAVDLLS